MRRILTLSSVLYVLFFIHSNAFGKATGRLGLEYGQSFPQSELAQYFGSGDAYRVNLFGGKRIKLAAIGLGWDITYANYDLKEAYTGHYTRVVWDWLFIPIGLGPFVITPGLAWVLTDASVQEWQLKEQSVRPAGVLALGFRFGLLPHLAFTSQVRGEWVWEDMEPVSGVDQQELNITGQYVTATAGVMAYF